MIKDLQDAIKHAREKAEELRERAYSDFDSWTDRGKALATECLECAAEHDQLADLLEELKARREADRWIPVTERLPEEGNKAYLVTVDYGNGVIASCQRFFCNSGIGWNDDCVTAWKEMPEAYKESEETK